MDGTKFDSLAKELARGISRRSMLKGLIGGGAAAVATTAGANLAIAQSDRLVTICHQTSSETRDRFEIQVAQQAVEQHLRKNPGDYAGACGCGSYILAGVGGPNSTFKVDDDLTIRLNGKSIYTDPSPGWADDSVGPLFFDARAGDLIEFAAYDTGGCRHLSPIMLYCADGSGSRLATGGDPCSPWSGEGYEDCTCYFDGSDDPYFTDSVVIQI